MQSLQGIHISIVTSIRCAVNLIFIAGSSHRVSVMIYCPSYCPARITSLSHIILEKNPVSMRPYTIHAQYNFCRKALETDIILLFMIHFRKSMIVMVA